MAGRACRRAWEPWRSVHFGNAPAPDPWPPFSARRLLMCPNDRAASIRCCCDRRPTTRTPAPTFGIAPAAEPLRPHHQLHAKTRTESDIHPLGNPECRSALTDAVLQVKPMEITRGGASTSSDRAPLTASGRHRNKIHRGTNSALSNLRRINSHCRLSALRRLILH